ncbi:hypothetical protein LEP1GSC070_4154 [Leptospira santarosai str. AIM]|uniref:Uncharacterized protein n=1 Tax=Leptospira santarosai serovar Shermani str. LT 821 TaxID=758847 RepID=K8Y5H8_9LEPT|nr:hypothetical protein LSS_19755 [Leptospira santarosai serovar Shermani str. LT 821]EMO86471.1 hypothetical protein LEP1GSC070_4154 [Leptospira santarosai str. AIM]EPG84256.1 hypothetical protein LEP1GSC048_0420 [Leptospira santarosai serovar Shermani str. 1342KT]
MGWSRFSKNQKRHKTNIMRIKWNEISELSHKKNRKFGAINSKKGSRFQEVNDVAKKSK